MLYIVWCLALYGMWEPQHSAWVILCFSSAGRGSSTSKLRSSFLLGKYASPLFPHFSSEIITQSWPCRKTTMSLLREKETFELCLGGCCSLLNDVCFNGSCTWHWRALKHRQWNCFKCTRRWRTNEFLVWGQVSISLLYFC